MARKKKTEDDKIGELEKRVRILKSINRGLLKKLKRVDREYRDYHQADFIDEKIEFALEKCQECGKGEIEEIDIVGRKFFKCTVCDYKGKKVNAK